MTIESAVLEHTEKRHDLALDALDQLAKLKEEISEDVGLILDNDESGKLDELKTVVECYRDLIVKGLLDPEIGIELVAELRIKNDL